MIENEYVGRFYIETQEKLQLAIYRILEEQGDLAQAGDIGAGDVAFCLGTVVASVMFETIRKPDQFTLTEDQEGLMEDFVEVITASFREKVELMSDPADMAVITGRDRATLH